VRLFEKRKEQPNKGKLVTGEKEEKLSDLNYGQLKLFPFGIRCAAIRASRKLLKKPSSPSTVSLSHRAPASTISFEPARRSVDHSGLAYATHHSHRRAGHGAAATSSD